MKLAGIIRQTLPGHAARKIVRFAIGEVELQKTSLAVRSLGYRSNVKAGKGLLRI